MEYRICPEKCRLELITSRPNAIYECRIDTPIKARQVQTVDLSKAPLRSPKAGGQLLFPRKLTKITFVKYLDGTEEPENPELLNVPPDPEPVPVPPETDEIPESRTDTEAESAPAPVRKNTSRSAVPETKPSSSADEESAGKDGQPKESKPVPPPEEEDNWGISQMDLGF